MKWEGHLRVPMKKLTGLLGQYKWVLLVLAVGLLLLLWPQGSTPTAEAAAGTGQESVFYDPAELENKMEKILSQIEGAGEVTVLLTVKSGTEWIYAADTEYSEGESGREERSSTVLISTGSGTEEAVVVCQIGPTFQGAVVVCDGGDDPDVRLSITQAVAALTGLRSDKITVCR